MPSHLQDILASRRLESVPTDLLLAWTLFCCYSHILPCVPVKCASIAHPDVLHGDHAYCSPSKHITWLHRMKNMNPRITRWAAAICIVPQWSITRDSQQQCRLAVV